MPHVQDHLPRLFALAQDHSEGARLRLAEELSDLFLGEQTPLSEREDRALTQLLEELLAIKSHATRLALVNKFTNAAHMPRSFALRVAAEPTEIARNILINSLTLSDNDLITLVETKGLDHARFIAQRQAINEAVSDALVATGDIAIMQTVAENMGAILSPKAIALMSDAARLTMALQKPLINRRELTEDAALKLYWWTARDIRRSILERFGSKIMRLEAALEEAINQKLSNYHLDKTDDDVMDNLANWLEERGALTPSLLLQILRQNFFRLFNIVVARMARLDLSLIDVIVADHGGRTLAAICKAIGVEKASFVSIFLLSRGARTDEHIVHPRELSFSLMAFDKMTPQDAENMVATWRADPSYLRNRKDDPA